LRIPGRFIVLLLVWLLSACSSNSASQPATLIPTETIPPIASSETPAPEVTSPAVEGRDPSYKVAAFYHPRYGKPETGGKWIHCILQIDRGNIGKTQVEVKTVEWDQVTSGRNSHQIAIPLGLLTTPNL
jgi:hypothetical protein